MGLPRSTEEKNKKNNIENFIQGVALTAAVEAGEGLVGWGQYSAALTLGLGVTGSDITELSSHQLSGLQNREYDGGGMAPWQHSVRNGSYP